MSGDLERRRQVYRLLEQVVARSAETREALLAAAPEGVGAEVEEILRPEDAPITLLDGPHPVLQRSPPGPLRQPETLGPYRILELLGEGGMGQVFLAEQREPVRRQVALKVLRTVTSGAAAEARFRTEGDAMARLDHPNVGRILEAGKTADGRPYFAMERIEGVAITRYCDRGQLSFEERIQLFVEVCRGIEHAHQKLLLHRDIKPSNVLVAEVDGKPTPRIIDFGLAKYLDETVHGAGLTGDHLIGTPAYMSPEALGLGGGVDTRTDVFSLGVLLYELITGVSPWDQEVRTPMEMLRYRSEAVPHRPSAQLTRIDPEARKQIAQRRRVTVAALEQRLRGDLEWIVLKAIEREPERRYGSAAELGADLERFLRHEPVTARPPSPLYRLRKTLVRHRGLVTMAALLSAVLVAGVVGTSVGLLRARDAEAQAKAEARQALEARNEARAVSEFLGGIFRGSSAYNPVAARPPSEISALELLERGSRRIEEELADQPLQAARLRLTLGEVYRTLDLLAEARRHLEAAIAALEGMQTAGATDRALLARVQIELAQVSVKQARWDEALDGLRRARALARVVIEEPELTQLEATTLDLESRVSRRQGRFDIAERQQRQAVWLLASSPDPHQKLLVAMLSNLGIIHFDQGRWAAAEAEFRRSLELARRVLPPGDLRTAQAVENLGAAVASQGRIEEAASLYAEALDLKRQVLSEDHPAIAISLNNLGQLHADRGRPDLAEPLHRSALALRRKALGAEHPVTAWSLDNLARTVADLGRTDEARALQEQALAVRRAALGKGHPQIARSLEHLGELARRRSELERAERYYREALAVRRSAQDSENPALAETAADLGALLLQRGRAAEARETLEEGLRALPAAPAGEDDRKLRERIETLLGQA